MSFRFNAPPGWPTPPEGWMPPPGWRPNAAWPPAPVGWQFYVEESSEYLDDLPARRPSADALVSVPAAGSGPQRICRRSWATRHRLLIGSGAAVLVLAGAAAYGSNGSGSSTVTTVSVSTASTAPPPTAAPTTASRTAPTTASLEPAKAPTPTTATHRSRTMRSESVPPGSGPGPTRRGPGDLCGAPANPFGYTFCGGAPVNHPAPSVCDHFRCIPSFWNGQGYLVQCQDGMYSLSGGRRGACSNHHGVRRPVFRAA